MAFFGVSSYLWAQDTSPATLPGTAVTTLQIEIPDAPTPQIELALTADPPSVDPQSGQAQTAQPPSTGTAPASTSAAQSSSSSQNSPQQPDSQQTKHQKQEQEVKEQEHQRLGGIIPEFNVSYHSDAVPLTPAEKFKLQFRAAIDPYTFSIAAIVAGLGEAEDSNTGIGWGPSGFAERAAAAYGDNVIGNTIGNAILPSILHQDPRYFRLGHGTVRHRFFYAVATAFICKHDTTRKWEPNYSNVLGNMIAGEISTLYYPNSKGDATQAIETGLTVTFEGTFGSTLEEFWPDISRKLFHRDPTHGLDAQLRAQDAAAEQKKQQEGSQKN
jgi:hypothetical protein